MRNDEEIDKLFKDALEEVNIPEIPQAYLDDINKRLDTISPQKGRGGYFSLLWFALLLGIVSTALYFSFFNKSSFNKDKNNSYAVNSTSKTMPNNSVKSSVTSDQTENSIHTKKRKENTPSAINSSEPNAKREEEGLNKPTDFPDSKAEENNTKNSYYSKNELNNWNKTEKNKNSKNDVTLTSDKSNNKPSHLNTKKNAENSTFNNEVKAGNVKENSEKKIDAAGEIKNKKTLSDNTKTKNKKSDSKITKVQQIETSDNSSGKVENNNTHSKTIANLGKIKNMVANNNVGIKKVRNKSRLQNSPKAKNNDVGASTAKNANDRNKKTSKENKIGLVATEANKKDSTKTDGDTALQADKKDSLTMQKTSSLVINTIADSLKKEVKDSISIAAKDSAKKAALDTSKALTIAGNDDNPKGIKFIRLIAGAYNVYSSFKQKNTTYNDKRKQEESPIWVYDASMLFDYERNRFVYSAGLNYSQWGEKINYKPTTDSVSYINGYDTTYITQQTGTNTFVTNGKINPNYKNKAVVNDKITAHNGVNTYSYVSIPFLLGYKLGGEKFSITPTIGGMVGVPVQSKGYYINNGVTEIIEEKAANWLFNVQASADVQTKLGTYINLCITPTVRYNATTLIQSAATENRYYAVGLTMGVSYIIH
jgi:hypothetical protein